MEKFSLVVVGSANCRLGWFQILKNSARNSKCICSRTGNSLMKDRSQFCSPGPRMMLRPALPNVPSTPLGANAQVLNSVPGRQCAPFGFPTTLGRAQLKTAPPQSELEMFTRSSVGVNQLPDCAETIPVTCQLPTIWLAIPVRFEPKCWPLPKGKLYTKLTTNLWRTSKSALPYSKKGSVCSRKSP